MTKQGRHATIAACVISALLLLGGIASAVVTGLPQELSPFGVISPEVDIAGYTNPKFYDSMNLGQRWARSGLLYADWPSIDPDLGSPPNYTWAALDANVASFPDGAQSISGIPGRPVLNRLMNIFVNKVYEINRRCFANFLPCAPNIPRYLAFVRAVVERYDGDGFQDAPNLVLPVHYWQVDNEPDATLFANFGELQKITYQAIKEADPSALVVIGGATHLSGPRNNEDWFPEFIERFGPILAELEGGYVDIFDIHYYGLRDDDYRMAPPSGDVIAGVQYALAAAGFPNIPIWITEMGSVSGFPATAPRTEAQQARDFLKRNIYPLSRGVKKVFVTSPMEGFFLVPDYFDYAGFIYDGRFGDPYIIGTRKLSYLAYKKLTDRLGGADWDPTNTIHVGTGTDWLYLFRVRLVGRSKYIAWWDYFDDPSYAPGRTKRLTFQTTLDKLRVTELVPNAASGFAAGPYNSAPFRTAEHEVVNDVASIDLTENPVLIEDLEDAVCGGRGRIQGSRLQDSDFGNDSLAASGRVIVSEPLLGADVDPLSQGARIRIESESGQLLRQLTVPGGLAQEDGPGWRRSGREDRTIKWSYEPADSANPSVRLSYQFRLRDGFFKFKFSAFGSIDLLPPARIIVKVFPAGLTAATMGVCSRLDLANCDIAGGGDRVRCS